jgi:hypothetical protein
MHPVILNTELLTATRQQMMFHTTHTKERTWTRVTSIHFPSSDPIFWRLTLSSNLLLVFHVHMFQGVPLSKFCIGSLHSLSYTHVQLIGITVLTVPGHLLACKAWSSPLQNILHSSLHTILLYIPTDSIGWGDPGCGLFAMISSASFWSILNGLSTFVTFALYKQIFYDNMYKYLIKAFMYLE